MIKEILETFELILMETKTLKGFAFFSAILTVLILTAAAGSGLAVLLLERERIMDYYLTPKEYECLYEEDQ